VLSNRGYQQIGGDWFNLRDRKGFSNEVMEDTNNPRVRDWVTAMLKEPVASDEFWFFIMAFHPGEDRPTQEFKMLARMERLGVTGVRVRLRSFVP
jgi:hypothetical protein